MARSGMYYNGKELLECQIDDLTPEQKQLMNLETTMVNQNELNRDLILKTAKMNADFAVEISKKDRAYTRNWVRKMIDCFRY